MSEVVARAEAPAHGMIAQAPAMLRVLEMAARAAQTDVGIMLLGESGVGKEVVSRYVHRSSPRAAGPFVAINCAAIPESLLEATLFGYERGAFTGASQAAPGKFEQAQGGTLLLDEVTEMAAGLQAKLLRVLQEREIERVGGRKRIALDLRVVATSNRDLQQAVQQGVLREDLYYRLSVFPLRIPALRERREDIDLLCETFLARMAQDWNIATPRLHSQARQRLQIHAFPGNVRELQNILERALALSEGQLILEEHLHIDSPAGPTPCNPAQELPAGAALEDYLQDIEKRAILQALEDTRWNRTLAAKKLGMSFRSLRYRLKKMGLDQDDGGDEPADAGQA